jgi:hypothetical protein
MNATLDCKNMNAVLALPVVEDDAPSPLCARDPSHDFHPPLLLTNANTMVAASKPYKAELRDQIRVLRYIADRAVATNNKRDAVTCSAMLEDVERDIRELRATTASDEQKTSVDYKRFIKHRAQADSENLPGWSKKEAKASGIGFMVTLYYRHLKDLGKSTNNLSLSPSCRPTWRPRWASMLSCSSSKGCPTSPSPSSRSSSAPRGETAGSLSGTLSTASAPTVVRALPSTPKTHRTALSGSFER